MMTEAQIKEKTGDQNVKEKLKQRQAINEDYEKTGYDRGHLNPRDFQGGDDCLATFTLTNAAPQQSRFNRVHWRKLECNLKIQLTEKCYKEKGKAFLVTGVVPDKQKKIPNKDNNRDPRVVVPSHFWTAVCCNHADNNKKFAFAFLWENEANSIPKGMTVKDLNTELQRLYGGNQAITILNDCNEDGQTGKDISAAISKKLHSNLPNTDQDPCQTPGSSGAKRRRTK
nr:endonuclease domain-containing 1 protein-like [Pelodiscus sinensis]|eukprot:XP_014429132.1 endonuclease domain-containing 1 protein-like [Pelodiscus sinensis]